MNLNSQIILYFYLVRFVCLNMSNQELLKASEEGNLQTVKRLLNSKKIDINTKDIWMQKILMRFKSIFFMILEISFVYGI